MEIGPDVVENYIRNVDAFFHIRQKSSGRVGHACEALGRLIMLRHGYSLFHSSFCCLQAVFPSVADFGKGKFGNFRLLLLEEQLKIITGFTNVLRYRIRPGS